MLPTVLICLALLLIVVFSVRSYLKKLKTGCCGSGGDQVKRVRPGDRDVSHYPYATGGAGGGHALPELRPPR